MMSNSMPPLCVSVRIQRSGPAEGPRSGIVQNAGQRPGFFGSFMRASKYP